MEALPGIWSLSPLGALIGVLILSFWQSSTGRQFSRYQHEMILKLANERADEWKRTAETERAVNAEIRKQNTMLLEAGRTGTEFFQKTTVDIEDTGDPRV